MAWQCPKCKKLQHQLYRCKFCGYREKRKEKMLTAEKLAAFKIFRMPEKYWIRKRKD